MMTFLLRRGLSMLGATGAAVSDEWIGQTVSLLLIAVNEAVNWYQHHKAEKDKAALVKVDTAIKEAKARV